MRTKTKRKEKKKKRKGKREKGKGKQKEKKEKARKNKRKRKRKRKRKKEKEPGVLRYCANGKGTMEGMFLSAKGRGQDRNENLILLTVQSRFVLGLCQWQTSAANDQRHCFML